jgi:hypothetical protein
MTYWIALAEIAVYREISPESYGYAKAFVDSLYRRGRTETPLASEFGIERAEAAAIRAECIRLRPELF